MPFDAVEPIACRCSEANRRAMPPDECRSEGTPSLSEGPDAWGEPFGSFLAFEKGTRRKGETLSGRYRRNGYVPYQQGIGRLSGRLREQARSHRWFGYIRTRLVGCQAVIAGRPAPTGDSGTSASDWSAVRPPSRASPLPQSKKKGTADNRQCLFPNRETARNQRDNIKVSYSRSSSAVDNRCSPSNTQTSNDKVNP